MTSDEDEFDVEQGSISLQSQRRRLRGGSSRGEGDSGPDLPEGAVQMGPLDFAGVFIVWAGVSIAVLVTTYCRPLLRACRRKATAVSNLRSKSKALRKGQLPNILDVAKDAVGDVAGAIGDVAGAIGDVTEAITDAVQEAAGGDETAPSHARRGSNAEALQNLYTPIKFSANDEAGMLREVLRQLALIRVDMDKDKAATGRAARVQASAANEKLRKSFKSVALARGVTTSFDTATISAAACRGGARDAARDRSPGDRYLRGSGPKPRHVGQ